MCWQEGQACPKTEQRRLQNKELPCEAGGWGSVPGFASWACTRRGRRTIDRTRRDDCWQWVMEPEALEKEKGRGMEGIGKGEEEPEGTWGL